MRGQRPSESWQFSLKSILRFVAVVSVVLAASVLFPRLAMATLPILSAAAVGVALLYGFDLAIHRGTCRKPIAVGSWSVISVSVWTIGFVIGLTLMKPDGGAGDFQYAAGDSQAEFVFGLRAGTILVLFVSPIICGVIGAFRYVSGIGVRWGWLAAGIGSYLVAWIVILFNFWFFPMV